jgi:hypothetical protein
VAIISYGTSTTTWDQWIDTQHWYSDNTASTGRDIIWNDWTTSTTSTTLTIQNDMWSKWQSLADFQWNTPAPETAEQLQARLDRDQARREENSRRQLAEQTRMEGAQERGMELLLMVLTNEERVWHDLHDEIMVRAESGRIYVIEKRGVHGNIKQVDEHGCLLGRVCVAPGMYDYDARLYLPLADGWLGQYLAIKHDEEALRATGNWSSRGACKQPAVPILGQSVAA